MDKMKHFVWSFFIAVNVCAVLGILWGSIITLAIGIAKEVYDKVSKKGCAEWLDMLADIVGILNAVSVIEIIRNLTLNQ